MTSHRWWTLFGLKLTWNFFGWWLVARFCGQRFGSGGCCYHVRYGRLRQPIVAQSPAAETVSGKRRVHLVTLRTPPVVLKDKRAQLNQSNKSAFVRFNGFLCVDSQLHWFLCLHQRSLRHLPQRLWPHISGHKKITVTKKVEQHGVH